MAGTSAAKAVLPGPCDVCGGEVHLEVTLPGALVSRCAHCGASHARTFEPEPAAAETLATVLRDRDRVRRRLRIARPMILLWLPPAAEDDDAYRDVSVMIAERVAADDPSIWLREEPYPESPEDETMVLASLADLSLLVAPGPEACDRALALLGEALPPSRATVFALGLTEEETREREHPRLRLATGPSGETETLIDTLEPHVNAGTTPYSGIWAK